MATLILIGGGSSSGKTTIARQIGEHIPHRHLAIISQDNFYKDISALPDKLREAYNFDHPDAVDFTELHEALSLMLQGQAVEIPVYNFVTNGREKRRETIQPSDVVILEGIFALYDSKVIQLADLRIYVEADTDTRLVRRIRRDIHERGYTVEKVLEQYERNVKPMHEAFIEPTKKHADVIIPGVKSFDIALEMIDGYLLQKKTKKEGPLR